MDGPAAVGSKNIEAGEGEGGGGGRGVGVDGMGRKAALCCAWFREGILPLDAVGFLSASSLFGHAQFDTSR